jgi:hypothetical protein
MSEETVSFYQIAKELAEEEQISVEVYDAEREVNKIIRLVVDGKVQDQSKFDTYRKKRQEYIEEIFKKAKVLDKYKVVIVNETTKKKETEFRIPVIQKEYVKFLLRQYTSAVSRKIRKDKIDKITTVEVKEEIDSIHKFLEKHVPEVDRENELVTAYVLTQLQSRTAFDEVETGLLKLMGDDLSQVKVRPASEGLKETKVGEASEEKGMDKELRIGNDSDAAFLMYYYYHLLQQQSKFWNEIVDMVDELRTEEIVEMEEAAGEVQKYQFRDIRSVVLKAHLLVIEQRMEDSLKDKNKPSPQQLKNVEEFLKNYGKALS